MAAFNAITTTTRDVWLYTDYARADGEAYSLARQAPTHTADSGDSGAPAPLELYIRSPACAISEDKPFDNATGLQLCIKFESAGPATGTVVCFPYHVEQRWRGCRFRESSALEAGVGGYLRSKPITYLAKPVFNASRIFGKAELGLECGWGGCLSSMTIRGMRRSVRRRRSRWSGRQGPVGWSGLCALL